MYSTLHGKAACLLSVETPTNLASTVQIAPLPATQPYLLRHQGSSVHSFGHWEWGCRIFELIRTSPFLVFLSNDSRSCDM